MKAQGFYVILVLVVVFVVFELVGVLRSGKVKSIRVTLKSKFFKFSAVFKKLIFVKCFTVRLHQPGFWDTILSSSEKICSHFIILNSSCDWLILKKSLEFCLGAHGSCSSTVKRFLEFRF